MDPEKEDSHEVNQTSIDAALANPENSKISTTKVKNVRNIDTKGLYYNLEDEGLAVIFNHVVYKYSYCNVRMGSSKDVERLKKCLNKLNFAVKSYDDLSQDDISKAMKAVASLHPSKLSCLIIVVMTHGENGKLAAYDKMYQSTQLWNPLIGKLVGIPKLFFIQSCRGGILDVGVEVTDSVEEDKMVKLPSIADFLFMYSAPEGYVSYLDENGSWFIKTLCNELEDKYEKYDLLQILTFVNKGIALDFEVYKIEDESKVAYKSISQIVSMLTKFLKFNPNVKAINSN